MRKREEKNVRNAIQLKNAVHNLSSTSTTFPVPKKQFSECSETKRFI